MVTDAEISFEPNNVGTRVRSHRVVPAPWPMVFFTRDFQQKLLGFSSL